MITRIKKLWRSVKPLGRSKEEREPILPFYVAIDKAADTIEYSGRVTALRIEAHRIIMPKAGGMFPIHEKVVRERSVGEPPWNVVPEHCDPANVFDKHFVSYDTVNRR